MVGLVSRKRNLKTAPQGAYELMNGSLNVPLPNQTALDRNSIDGIRLKAAWNDIETSPGVFDWANLDGAVAQAAAKGKKCGISFGARRDCPAWLFSGPEIPVHAVPYVMQDGPHAGDTIAVIGDPIWEAHFIQWIADVGARYSNNATVTYIQPSGIGITGEWYVSQGPLDEAALMANQTMVDAWVAECKIFIDHWLAAFPTTNVIAALAKPCNSSMGFPAMITLDDYGLTRRNWGIMWDGLNALSNTGYEPVNQLFLHWQNRPTGAQFTAADGNPANNGTPLSEGMDEGLRAAFTLNARFVEIYKTDCDNDAAYDYLSPAGSIFQGNDISGTPAGITNRRADLLTIPLPV